MIYVECKPDFTLVKTLSTKEVEHAGNKSEVCKKLQNNNNSIGLIDEDPDSSQPPYLNKLILVAEKYDMKLLQDNKRQNFVIILSPMLEGWILKVSKNNHIDVAKYGLPGDASKLHKIINISLNKFKKLLVDLQRSKEMKTLKTFLR